MKEGDGILLTIHYTRETECFKTRIKRLTFFEIHLQRKLLIAMYEIGLKKFGSPVVPKAWSLDLTSARKFYFLRVDQTQIDCKTKLVLPRLW